MILLEPTPPFQQVHILSVIEFHFYLKPVGGKNKKNKIKGLLNGMILPKSFKSILPSPALPSFVNSLGVHKAKKPFLEYLEFSSEEKPVHRSTGKFVCGGLQPGSGSREPGMPSGSWSS